MRMPSPLNKLRSALQQVHLLGTTLGIVWDAARRWCVLWAVLLVISGFLPALQVYLARPLVDSLTAALQTGFAGEPLHTFVLYAVLVGSILLLAELTASALAGTRAVQAELVEDHITNLVHQQAIEADLAHYETPKYYDDLHRARDQASSRSLTLLENIGGLAQNGISVMSIAVILLQYGPLIPALLVLSTLPALYGVARHQWHSHQWWWRTTAERRWANYYAYTLTVDWAAEEQRLFGWGPSFQRAYQDIRTTLRQQRFRLIREQTLTQVAASLAALVFVGIALLWMIRNIARGLATLGDLALFYQAFNQGQRIIRSLLTSAAQIVTNLLYLESLERFLNITSSIASPEDPRPFPAHLQQGVRFKNISFRYPGSDRYIFESFDLAIPAGKTVAVVGDNGAGKTTLTKLLCRFYDPETGTVEIDGIDIREFDVETLRSHLSVLFQLPVTYARTAEENISIGDPHAPVSFRRVEKAARAAGAHSILAGLKKGYATMLGKLFEGGTNLSGGERQRVALARAFYRDADIVILDEPTSFMDSWAEAEWLDRFLDHTADKTTLIITHRFTTARHADEIIVLRNGQIVERGTHSSLVDRGGLYAQSWLAQTQSSPYTAA